jgi:hypothetical protein
MKVSEKESSRQRCWSESVKSSKICYDRRSGDQPTLVSSIRPGPKITFLLLSDRCGFVDVRRPLWRQDRSVIYNCWWSSLAQSFSGPGIVGLITVFCCFRFETPQTWRARSPYLYLLRTGWLSYFPRHLNPFSSPPTTRRATVDVSEICASAQTAKRIPLVRILLLLYVYSFREKMFTESPGRNGHISGSNIQAFRRHIILYYLKICRTTIFHIVYNSYNLNI